MLQIPRQIHRGYTDTRDTKLTQETLRDAYSPLLDLFWTYNTFFYI